VVTSVARHRYQAQDVVGRAIHFNGNQLPAKHAADGHVLRKRLAAAEFAHAILRFTERLADVAANADENLAAIHAHVKADVHAHIRFNRLAGHFGRRLGAIRFGIGEKLARRVAQCLTVGRAENGRAEVVSRGADPVKIAIITGNFGNHECLPCAGRERDLYAIVTGGTRDRVERNVGIRAGGADQAHQKTGDQIDGTGARIGAEPQIGGDLRRKRKRLGDRLPEASAFVVTQAAGVLTGCDGLAEIFELREGVGIHARSGFRDGDARRAGLRDRRFGRREIRLRLRGDARAVAAPDYGKRSSLDIASSFLRGMAADVLDLRFRWRRREDLRPALPGQRMYTTALLELRKAEALNTGQTNASGGEAEIYLFQAGKPDTGPNDTDQGVRSYLGAD
jgi:hypothetical protein